MPKDIAVWVAVIAIIGALWAWRAHRASDGFGNRNDTASQTQAAGAIRQTIKQGQDLTQTDPFSPGFDARFRDYLAGQRDALAGVEIKPVHDYTPKTELGRSYKDLYFEIERLAAGWDRIFSCNASIDEIDQIADDSISIEGRSVGLAERLASLLESGQGTADLGADLERILPAIAAKDLEVGERFGSIAELEATFDRCQY